MEENNKGKIAAAAGWSWGAFLLNAPFLVGIKKYKMLWWYILAFVPFVNVIFWIVFMIYLGVKGHELGATSPQFASQAEYDGFFKALDHAGKILFFVAIALLVIFVAFGFTAAVGRFFLSSPFHRPY
ncbi:hypothetical protein M1432_00985 [Patescibacteria group bacterium]|nr:hypothetical protein [Patescibacteria group bacterium]